MNAYQLVCTILNEFKIPLPEIGDIVLKGKWRNSPATVTGYKNDSNHQPQIRTNKGVYSLYKFRLQKLMPKSKINTDVKESVEVTPLLKRFKISKREIEVCPHCFQEIGEKEVYVDSKNYMYHRPCINRGPIKKIEPISKKEIQSLLGWNH